MTSIVSHVEPFDLGNFDKPDYYWGYQSPKFKELYSKSSPRAADRPSWWVISSACYDDCVHAFLYQPQWVTVAHKNLRGLWKDMPIFVNDVRVVVVLTRPVDVKAVQRDSVA